MQYRAAHMISLSGSSEEDDDDDQDDEDLILDWVPRSFIPDEVFQLLQEKEDSAAEKGEAPESVTLSEFDVAGPAVLYGFRSLFPWAFALAICLVAYHSIGDFRFYMRRHGKDCIRDPERGEECAAFLSYPICLWLLFVPVAFFIWHVQMRCLSYVILPQVQLLGGGFTIFGLGVSFRVWKCFAFVVSVATVMDITSQCLFYAQFLRSVERTPEIAQVWKATARASWESFVPGYSSIVLLFTVCWSMMFLQMIYMILHMVADEPRGVNYHFQSMRLGYTTVGSRLHRVRIDLDLDHRSDDCDKEDFDDRTCCGCLSSSCELSKQGHLVSWHADILRVLAVYGRMPALVLNNMDLLAARLDRELEKPDLVRYLQILFIRLKDNVSRIILLDILELAFKLEIQVTILSIELALNPASLGAAALQMCFAIALSLFNVMLRMTQNIQAWRSFHRMYNASPGFHSKQCERNWQVIRRTLWLYLAVIVIFGLFILHSVVKFKMAFTCEFSMWNLNGCVEFESIKSAGGERMLVLD